jgi:hypothetical protein
MESLKDRFRTNTMNTFMCLGTGSGHNGLWNHLIISSEQIFSIKFYPVLNEKDEVPISPKFYPSFKLLSKH